MRFSLKRNNAFLIIMEGIAYTIALNICNAFMQMFAKRIGAQDIHIALLNSLPPFVTIFILIPFALLIEKVNRKKKTISFMIFLVSLFYIAIAFVPFIPGKMKVIAYVALIGLMNCPGSLYLATWQAFYADMFSGSIANRIYSDRSKYGTFFGLITILLTGLILTEIPKTDGERLLIYQIFYFVCFIISLLQIYFLSNIKEHSYKQLSVKSDSKASVAFGISDIRNVFANKKFITFCICVFMFYVTWQMAWPLLFIYNANYAMLNEFQLGVVNVANGFAQFLTFSLWSKLIEKKGSMSIIILGAFGLAINPLFYIKLFDFPIIILGNVLSGMAFACFTLALFSGLIGMLPPTKKTIYTAVYNTILNISGFISPLIGIWVYRQLNIYSTMFLISTLRLTVVGLCALGWLIYKRKQKRISENEIKFIK
jgi:MFS family permease